MVELEEFYDFTLDEGVVWIGDPAEVFTPEEWEGIADAASETPSFKGYMATAEGMDFFLIDKLFDEPWLLQEITKGLDSLSDAGLDLDQDASVETIDEFTPESGYLMVAHDEELCQFRGRDDNEDLESGSGVELQSAVELRVTFRGIHLGVSFLLTR